MNKIHSAKELQHEEVLSALLAAAMILSLAACSGGTTTSSSSSSTASSDSSTESSTVSSESEATEDDPILTGEKPELKILSMYQAYNYEEQRHGKSTKNSRATRPSGMLCRRITPTRSFCLRSPAAQTTTSCSEFLQASTHSSLSRTH